MDRSPSVDAYASPIAVKRAGDFEGICTNLAPVIWRRAFHCRLMTPSSIVRQLILCFAIPHLSSPESWFHDLTRLFLQLRHERPLVRPCGPSRQSEFAPELEQCHLATIVAQFELHSVMVLAFDVWGKPTDGQVTDAV